MYAEMAASRSARRASAQPERTGTVAVVTLKMKQLENADVPPGPTLATRQ
jgi:hypothetical protein